MRGEIHPSYMLRAVILCTAWTIAFTGYLLFSGDTARAQVAEETTIPVAEDITDVKVSQERGNERECAIAQNPSNKDQLFVLCMSSKDGLLAAQSADRGATWTTKTIADGTAVHIPGGSVADPALAWDTFGNLFIAYLTPGNKDVVLLLSQDGGTTITHLHTFTGGCFFDQPTVVAANTSDPKAPVAVWVVWNEKDSVATPLDCGSPGSEQMRASATAVTGLGRIGPFIGHPEDPGRAWAIPAPTGCTFGDVAIAPSGAVVQACQIEGPEGGRRHSFIIVNIKADGLGRSNFGRGITATATDIDLRDVLVLESSGRNIDAEVGLAFDSCRSSPRFGRLYLVYADEANSESVGISQHAHTHIMVRFSDDGGRKWSRPIHVNGDLKGRESLVHTQFNPRIAVSPLSGNIAVCWLDTRGTQKEENAVHTLCSIATPTDPVPSFLPSKKISEGESSTDDWFGDYSGLVYLDDVAHPVWADNSETPGYFDAHMGRLHGGSAASEGQLHITTLNGVQYDFQATGEFVALRGNGVEIQTRHAATATPCPTDNPAPCVSFTSAVAARVGKHRVSYQPSISDFPDRTDLQLWIDDKRVTLDAHGVDLGSGGRVMKPPTGDGIEIDFPNGTYLIATPHWWASQRKWYMNVNVYHTTATQGILGVARDNWLPAFPDGRSLGPMPTALHDRQIELNQLANTWRVTKNTSLFHHAVGTSTAKSTLPNPPPKNPPWIRENAADLEVAHKSCDAIFDRHRRANCLSDVFVTGERAFAEAYLITQKIEIDSTTINVRAANDRTQVNEPVTFIATVARTRKLSSYDGSLIPAGTVQFSLDGAKEGMPVKLDSNGQSTWTTYLLRIGTHRVSASYTPTEGSELLPSHSRGKTLTVIGKLSKGSGRLPSRSTKR